MPFSELHISQKKDLPRAARQLLELAGSRRKMAFYGEMGAGKTTFIRAICRELGSIDEASSPTFSLVNPYFFEKNGQSGRIFHLDLYRLKTFEEALDIGLEEILYDDSFCFIEWPQLLEPVLPEDTLKIRLETTGQTSRRLLIL